MKTRAHHCSQCRDTTCHISQVTDDDMAGVPFRCPFSDAGDDASEWKVGRGPDECAEHEDYIVLSGDNTLRDAVILGTLIRNTASGLSTTMYSRLKEIAGYYVLWFEAAGRTHDIETFKETVALICQKYGIESELEAKDD